MIMGGNNTIKFNHTFFGTREEEREQQEVDDQLVLSAAYL
jgi:hypothetical protein